MIIGVPLFGSIINARIFTSISIKQYPLPYRRTIYSDRFTNGPVQTVCLGGGHRDVDYFTFEAAIAGKVNDLVARGVPRQIDFRSGALILDQHLQSSTNIRLINTGLGLSLRGFKLE